MKFTHNTSNLAKILAIILVITGHYSGFLGIDNLYVANSGAVGVGIFLFVSAYGLSASMEQGDEQLQTFWVRILNLVIVYEFATLLKAIISIVFFKESVAVSVKALVGLGFKSNLDPTMWYMFYIIMVYIVFWISHLLIQSELCRVGLIFISCSVFAVLSSYIVIPFAFPLGYLAFLFKNKSRFFYLIVLSTLFLGLILAYQSFFILPITHTNLLLLLQVSYLPIFSLYFIEWGQRLILKKHFIGIVKTLSSFTLGLYLFEGFPLYNSRLAELVHSNLLFAIPLVLCFVVLISYFYTVLIINRFSNKNLKKGLYKE
ncbi:hypothetical protein RV11_GL003209 [Enterococcus phoeniculicola]|uniref:Acyltransferase 3 domain-containing protein n=1 Tax=Enterococcus phoeniculicola ATCC BAA-412 TaxID=1158610 RepID=R3W5Y9_9ENTE|nr:acyltransferase family protein [Enterococcus phoeniculicola]EOL42972.1 hypothetical protein UC3_01949 [Enterococcus phoeniculicola ATCC BAA-412]EOT76670.1 hypothetical protein I589_01627 [Enterococcus phoeniculicola ATCC BAA-412]OJG72238.1 hypothetical protein RV11_GL003209 [Enterococcus phoeniculicola]